MYSPHPESAMYVQTFRNMTKNIGVVTQPAIGFAWDGVVKYTRRPRTRPQHPEPPTLATPYTIAFNFNSRQEVLEVDRFGNMVANSIGDKFDTPPMARVNEPAFTISRSEWWNPLQKLMDFNPKYGAVNANPFWIFNARTLYLQIGASYHSENGWSLQYQFSFNYDTWDYSALNAGYFKKEGGEKVRILEETVDKKPVQKPKALTLLGEIVAENAPGHMLWWEKAVPMNFSVLNLPNIMEVW